MPARLTMEDSAVYHASAVRVVNFVQARPLTHILGGHIELDTAGHAYGMGSHYHPNERRLELSKEDLLALPAALEGFNGFYARYPSFILSNPRHNLAAVAISADAQERIWSQVPFAATIMRAQLDTLTIGKGRHNTRLVVFDQSGRGRQPAHPRDAQLRTMTTSRIWVWSIGLLKPRQSAIS